MPDPEDDFPSRLKKAMSEENITQAKLASLLGTSQPAVSQWLTGKKDPSDDNLADLARHLGIQKRWLLEGIPPMRTVDAASDQEDYAEHAGWGFRQAPADGGRDYGNANVWSFDPGLSVLVREVLQNAKDAAISGDKKVEVTFRIITLTGSDFTDYQAAVKWDDLQAHLDVSAAPHNKQKLGTLLRDGLDRVDRDDGLVLLVVEDRGTSGLTGPETGSGHFTALCRNNLDSNKDKTGAGGAFGLGKAVLWRASRLSTVLFCSHLARPEDGHTHNRVFGRCELAWHKEAGGQTYAGPGWFGRTAEDGTAASYWGNETLARDLYLDREGTGTTACVVGFHDASDDKDRKPVELAQDLVRAAAENFFPALVADKLGVRVEVYDSGRQYRDRKPAFAQEVNPEPYLPAAVRMLRAYWQGTTTDHLGEDTKDVAARDVILAVPKRTKDQPHAEQEHKAVLLVTPADEDADDGETPNYLAMFRGPGMVVQSKSLAGVCLGARPFHALLLAGRAPEIIAGEVVRPNPHADQAAEMFLRTAEPPSHDKWTATPDLKSVYALGCKARLDAFLKAAGLAVADLVKPSPKDTGDGPNALKELFRIGGEPAARAEQPRVVDSNGRVDADGRWHVSARVRLKARKKELRLYPAVYFLAETGSGTPVPWHTLRADKGCEVRGGYLIVPPDTREVRFSGATDPSKHPIPAADSCVVVDIKKVIEGKEVKS